jgi:class 3 adenylate cyclase
MRDELLEQIGRFLSHVQDAAEPHRAPTPVSLPSDETADLDRVLATVLFTDIVGSTEHAIRLGDSGWREVVEKHHSTVRKLLARYRGREIDTTGDGFFSVFDGPARAVRCAAAAVEAVKPLGIEIRAGVHTGEVKTISGKTGGFTVIFGSRVGSIARPSEVLVSHTVKDLVAGSGLIFDDRGDHSLKGIPGEWRLYSVARLHDAPQHPLTTGTPDLSSH